MAGSPQFKIFDAQGEYRACVKYLEDAASLAALYGDGATVRNGHSKKDTLWTEGSETFSAGESYDKAARIMEKRRFEMTKAAMVRVYGAERVEQMLAERR